MSWKPHPKRPVLTRLMEKIDPNGPGGCWLWTGALDNKGYSALLINGKRIKGHRASYELFVGPIPEGLQIDHLCRVRGCVNPAHLEPVTGAENVRRGIVAEVNAAIQLAKTHCPRDHPYDEANTYYTKVGSRRCRKCHCMQQANYIAKVKGKAA